MIVFYNVVHSPCAVEREVQAFEKKKGFSFLKVQYLQSAVLLLKYTTAKTVLKESGAP